MVYNEIVLPKHGFGLIEYEKNGIKVKLESNLTLGPNKMFIEIELENGMIKVNYMNYDSSFNKKTRDSLEIIISGKSHIVEYDEDDNIYYSLKKYLFDLDNDLNIDQYKKEILNFSKTLSFAIQNEGLIANEK